MKQPVHIEDMPVLQLFGLEATPIAVTFHDTPLENISRSNDDTYKEQQRGIIE